MDRLEGAQIEALQRLQSVLGPHDTDFVIAVLESVAWDVQVSICPYCPRLEGNHSPSPRTQKATDLLFDNENTTSNRAPAASESNPSSKSPLASQLELDDIQDSSLAIHRPQRGGGVRMSSLSVML